MARNIFWVSPRSSGDWHVIKEGAQRATSVHQTKEEAERAGAETAKRNQPSQLKVQLKNGQIEYEHTYGSDPYPPKG